jgi:hypothetical protein
VAGAFRHRVEAGNEAAGQRANYGASPGDSDHDEPYVYVGPWTAEASGQLWNATSFRGAEIAYAELVRADDPVSLAIEFMQSRYEALAGAG